MLEFDLHEIKRILQDFQQKRAIQAVIKRNSSPQSVNEQSMMMREVFLDEESYGDIYDSGQFNPPTNNSQIID